MKEQHQSAKRPRGSGNREGAAAVVKNNAASQPRPNSGDYIQRMRGSLKGKPSALDYLLRDRRREQMP